MKFSRVEVKRIVRYTESVTDSVAVKAIFQDLSKRGLKFSCKLRDFGNTLEECVVVSISDDSVRIKSRKPQILNVQVEYHKIDDLEVKSEKEITDEDAGDRWSMLD